MKDRNDNWFEHEEEQDGETLSFAGVVGVLCTTALLLALTFII